MNSVPILITGCIMYQSIPANYSWIPHLRNHFLKMSLNHFLIQRDLLSFSGGSFLNLCKCKIVHKKMKFV